MFDSIGRLARFQQRRMPLGDGFKLSPCVTAIAAHGHEVGHTAFEVSSAGETLLIWGDIVHVPSIQFERPELTWEYDTDQDQACVTRHRMLRQAAKPNFFVAGSHLEFPGIGKITESDGAFRYTAL